MQARPETQGQVHPHRRTGQIDVRSSGRRDRRARIVTVREPEVRRLRHETEGRRTGFPARADGDREGHTGRRQDLPVE